jgi:hypothetical protein
MATEHLKMQLTRSTNGQYKAEIKPRIDVREKKNDVTKSARVTSLYELSPVATNSRIESSLEELVRTTRYGTVMPQRDGPVVQSGTKRHQLANRM